MIVVPIRRDKIKTKDGITCKVIEYTNYKEAGPAVYALPADSKTPVVVYFNDIESINGTRVEYQKGPKVFHALGKIKRLQHLPQPGDEVTVESADPTRVTGLKLKSKNLGVNKGMFVKCGDAYYRLRNVQDIKRDLGTSIFNRDDFLSTYKDYLGV